MTPTIKDGGMEERRGKALSWSNWKGNVKYVALVVLPRASDNQRLDTTL